MIIFTTLIAVAVAEGLPLAANLALGYATKRITAENIHVRVMDSCSPTPNSFVTSRRTMLARARTIRT